MRACSTVLGKPGEGAHRVEIPGVRLAVVDLVLTYALALAIAGASRYAHGVPTVFRASVGWFVLLWAAGILLHLAFGVQTKLVTAMFGRICRGS